MRSVALVEAAPDAGLVGAEDVLRGGRRVDDRHERLVAVGVAYSSSSSAWVTGRVGRTWHADRMPRVIGMRWGRKSTPATPGFAPSSAERAQLLLDLADVAVA